MSENDGPVLSERKQRKLKFRENLDRLIDEYPHILLLNIDNVGSNQMQLVRQELRGKAEMLMGKNTIMRLIVREAAVKKPELEQLLPMLRGNVGLCFCKDDIKSIRDIVISNQVPAAARAGALAERDVTIPAGPTGLDPGQTNFFQALNIATKITKGTIEIINPVELCKAKQRVSPSAVALLGKLNIKPFFYGIKVTDIYENGSFYSAEVLDWTDAILKQKFAGGVAHVAAISLAINYPTKASLPHSIINAFRKLVAIAMETEYNFPQAEKYKNFVPEEAPAAAPAGEAAKAPEPEPEEEEEDDEMFGGGLFD